MDPGAVCLREGFVAASIGVDIVGCCDVEATCVCPFSFFDFFAGGSIASSSLSSSSSKFIDDFWRRGTGRAG